MVCEVCRIENAMMKIVYVLNNVWKMAFCWISVFAMCFSAWPSEHRLYIAKTILLAALNLYTDHLVGTFDVFLLCFQ